MPKIIIRLVLALLALAAGWGIYQQVILPSGAFEWDEAAHSIKGLLIAHDVKTGNWLGLLYDTYRQVYWPPLHSWLTGIAFVFCEPSAVVARTVSLIMFLLTAAVIYLTALQLQQSSKEVAAVVATCLFLTCPLIITFAGQAMLEVPGLFFVSLALLVYAWLNARPHSAPAHAWLGISIALAYFTRTNYGILLILAWGITTLLGGGPRAFLSRANFYTLLPLILAFAIWFAYPPKISSTLAALVNVPWGMEEPYSLEGFCYYPNVILHLFGSIWRSVVPVAALFLAVSYWRRPPIRFLILISLILVGLALAHHQRVERHMFPMIPPLVLITGFVFAENWNRFVHPVSHWGLRVFCIALCLSGGIAFANALHPTAVPVDRKVADAVAQALLSSQPSFLVGSRDIRRPCPPLLDWELIIDKRGLGVTHSGIAMNMVEDRRAWETVKDSRLPSLLKRQLYRVMTRAEQPAPTRSLYIGIPPEASYSNGREKAASFLRSLNSTGHFQLVALATGGDADPACPPQLVDGTLRSFGLAPVSTQLFAGSNVQLEVYTPPSKQ